MTVCRCAHSSGVWRRTAPLQGPLVCHGTTGSDSQPQSPSPLLRPLGEVRSVGVIPNQPESIQKLLKKLGDA